MTRPWRTKAVFEECPALVPAEQPRVYFEALEQPQVSPELGHRIANDGQCLLAQCQLSDIGTQKPVDSTKIG